MNGHAYGFNRATGAVRWEYMGRAPFESGIAIVGGVGVSANLAGDIVGLDAETGVVRFSLSTGGSSVIEQVTADATCAYVSEAAIECIDPSGTVRWTSGGASQGGPLYSTAVSTYGGRLYVGSFDGFHALKPQ